MNKLLSKAKKSLDYLFTESVEDNALHLCINKDEVPFLILLTDTDYPDTIIISLAADFQDCFLTSRILLDIFHVAKIELGESFLISDKGEVIIGQDCDLKEMLDGDDEFLNLPMASQMKH